jgi:hypothetical protein
MLKRFIERAAAKASLTNINFDLDQLEASFPNSVTSASNALFKLLENITLAFSNNASEAEVQQVLAAKSATYPSVLREIIDELFQLVLATRRGDSDAVRNHDSRVNDLFESSTGTSIDVTKLPWFSKLASG